MPPPRYHLFTAVTDALTNNAMPPPPVSPEDSISQNVELPIVSFNHVSVMANISHIYVPIIALNSSILSAIFLALK